MTRLKDVAILNRQALPENTDADRLFRYVDIGSVDDVGGITDAEELRFEAAPSRARRLVQPGDSIVSTVRTYLRAIAHIEGVTDDLVVSTGFTTLSPRRGVHPRFLFWTIRGGCGEMPETPETARFRGSPNSLEARVVAPAASYRATHVRFTESGLFRDSLRGSAFVEDVVARSAGVSYPAITATELGILPVAKPTLEEQRRIADYLDAETARIDELIAEQEQQMCLVDERFQAWLVQVVTRGFGKRPTRVSSDLGGLLVPLAWDVRRLGTLDCEIQTGPFGSQLHQMDYVDEGYPVVNPANLIDGRIVPTPGMTVDTDTRNRLSRHVLDVGDVVFGRRGEMGRAGLVTALEEGWLCGTGSLRIRFRKQQFDPGYLQRLLGASLIKQYLEAMSVGATMDNLNSSIVARIPIPVPPLNEQQQLARALDESEIEAEHLISELDQAIDLLRERRQALITTAVTRGIDGLPGVA